MRGVITDVKKSMSGMMFITGEDNNIYFSHRNELTNIKQWKNYVYLGASCSFDVEVVPEEKHNRAVNVVMDYILDPRHNEKLENKRRNKEAHEEKEKTKARNIEIAKLKKERAEKNKQFKKEHTVYIICVKNQSDSEWIMMKGNIFINDVEAKEHLKILKKDFPNQRFQIRKCHKVIINGKNTYRFI